MLLQDSQGRSPNLFKNRCLPRKGRVREFFNAMGVLCLLRFFLGKLNYFMWHFENCKFKNGEKIYKLYKNIAWPFCQIEKKLLRVNIYEKAHPDKELSIIWCSKPKMSIID